ncbi:phage holin family protein [Streptomyces capparidis]
MAGLVDDRPADVREHSVGELVKQASEQISHLVRQELRLAQVEMTHKGKRLGRGGGLFGGAGMMGFLALQALVAAAIAGIAVALPVWAAALIVAGGLAFVAALLGLLGKEEIHRATPPRPEHAIDSVKADMEEIRERAHHR